MNRQTLIALRMLPFVGGVFLLLLLNRVEHHFFPVVKDFVVMSMERTPHSITLSGYMRKVRSCQFLGAGAFSNPDHGNPAELDLYFLDDPRRTATRPTGTQGWGPWQVTLPVTPEVSEVELMATHRCHPFWASQTDLATIPVPPLTVKGN